MRKEVVTALAESGGQKEEQKEEQKKEQNEEQKESMDGEPEQGELEEERREALYRREIELTSLCLSSSPKSYGAWHHRSWALAR